MHICLNINIRIVHTYQFAFTSRIKIKHFGKNSFLMNMNFFDNIDIIYIIQFLPLLTRDIYRQLLLLASNIYAL